MYRLGPKNKLEGQGKVYKKALMYDAEMGCKESSREEAMVEMSQSRLVCSVTNLDRIRNEINRGGGQQRR